MKGRLLLIYSFLLLILASSSLAVGLAGRTFKYDFDLYPGFHQEIGYVVTTNSGFTEDYWFYVEARTEISKGIDFSKYITFEPEILRMIPQGVNPPFKIIIKFPDPLPEELVPGLHKVYAGVVESKVRGGGGAIGAKAASEVTFNFRVLCEGICVKAKLNIEDVNENETADIEATLENWGEKDIKKASAIIDIHDPEENKIRTFVTEEQQVMSAKNAVFKKKLDTTGMQPGKYNAAATFFYDGNQTDARDTFNIGTLDIKITNYTQMLEKDKISPFNVIVESKWANALKNVYADIEITNSRYGFKRIKTPTIELQPFKQAALTGFIDTIGLPLGENNASIKVYYEDKAKSEKGTVNIYEIRKPIYTGMISLTNILLLILILLILVNFIWFTRKKKKNEKENKNKKKK